jgi:hypothetical protein
VGGSVVNAVDSQKYKTFYSYLHNNAMTWSKKLSCDMCIMLKLNLWL